MRWKWVLGILAALIIVGVGAVYVIWSIYDFNDFKPRIIQTVKAKTGRELTLAGDIKLRIGFTPALVVEGVSFQNAPWGSRQELARMKRFEIQLALLPLISGDIEIRRLILIEPDILIETDHSGRSNLRFKASKKPEKKPIAAEETFLPVFRFNEIKIVKGRFAYKNRKSGRYYGLGLESFTAKRTRAGDRINLKIKGSFRGRPVEIAGTTGLFASIADPHLAWPLKLTAKAAKGSITLDGTIKDVLNGKGLDLTMTAQGRSIPDLADFAGVTGLPDIGAFRAKFKVSDPGGRLTVKNLDVTIGSMALAKIDLQGVIRDPLKQRGIDIDFQIQGKNLANLKRLSGKPLPLKGPFKIHGQLMDLAPQKFNIFHLEVTLGKNRLEGSIEIGLAGKQPRLKAILSSEKLDLRPLMAKKKKKRSTKQQALKSRKPGKVFPTEPFVLDALRLADARVKFRAGEFLLPRLAFKKLKLDVNLKNRRLVVRSLKAKIGGGALDAYFRLDARKKVPRVQTILRVQKLDLRRMLKDLGYEKTIAGKLDLDMTLKGRGNSLARIMAGLDGKILAVVGKGRIGNKYLEMLGSNLSSSLFQLLNPLKADVNYTQFNCFVNRFDIKAGLAEATALVVDTPAMIVVGQGEVNLKTEELDLSLDPSPKSGVIGLSLSLAELQPFRLSGTLARPSMGIDPTKATITLGKAVGGFVLFGPAGILAVLAGKSSGDENPCLAAIKAAEKGFRTPVKKKSRKKKTEKKKNVIEKTTEGIRKTFKKLFDR